MPPTRFLLGVSIEGLGDTSLAGDTLRLSTERQTVGSLEYVPALAALPDVVRSELDALEGSVTLSSITLTADMLDDLSGTTWGRALLRFVWGAASVRPDQRLTPPSVLDKTTTTISALTIIGGATPDVDDVLFLGREAMIVTGHGPTTVTRGDFGTEAEIHTQLDPWIYVGRNPVTRDRKVELIELDVDAVSETTIGRGALERASLDSELQVLSVRCRDVLAMLSRSKPGAGRLRATIRLERGVNSTDSQLWCTGLDHDQSPLDYEPIYPDEPGFTGSDVFDKAIAIITSKDAVPLAICAIGPTGVRNHPLYPWAYDHSPAQGPVYEIQEGRLDASDYGGAEFEAEECLVADELGGLSLFRDAAGDYSSHPADLIRCILCSTGEATWEAGASHTVGPNGDYDWLPKPWGAAIPDSWIDHDSFDALVDSWPTSGLRANNFYLRAGSDSFWQVCSGLAQSMCAYLYQDAQGRIACRRLADPGDQGIDATLLESDLEWVRAGSLSAEPLDLEPITDIELDIGSDGPEGPPRQIIKGGDLRDIALARFRYTSRVDHVESTKGYGSPIGGRLSAGYIGLIAEAFRMRWLLTQHQLPVYDLRLYPHAPRVTAGQWVALTHSLLFIASAPHGIEDEYGRGVAAHRFLVLAADYRLEDRTQRIRVLHWSLISGDTRPLAPSWRISAVSSNVRFNVESATFSDDDPGEWVDDADGPVHLWTPQGTLRSTDGTTFGTIAGVTVDLDAAWMASGSPVTPNVGDIVRVADYDNNTEWNVTWLSDANAELGSGNAPATNWDV